MSKSIRKRRKSDNRMNNKTPEKKVKRKRTKKILESEKECLAEINNNIEIIRLDENLFENEENEIQDDEDDEDGDWESVSNISDKSDIIINLREEEFNPLAEKNNEERRKQKLIREMRTCIHRTLLMSLIGRVFFIDRLCKDNLLRNISWSFIGEWNKNWNENKLHKLFINLKSRFELTENDINESGNIYEILRKALETQIVSDIWINVLFVTLFRSAGVETRLVAVIYPNMLKNLKTSNGKTEDHCILVKPTVHKPSTRGSKKPKISKKQKTYSFDIPTKVCNETILFVMELLDSENKKWIPVDARNRESWNDLSTVICKHPQFLYCICVQNDGSVKNLASKYDVNWATTSRRLRIPDTSFNRIIKPFIRNVEMPEDLNEKIMIRNRLMEQGVPTTLVNLKGHPLFVLKSHLLKYEVLYPPDVTPYTMWRNEEVYLRENVRLAHTKETWLKEAKTIKPNEVPCKKVKTMCSQRKHSERGADPYVDLFGPWQVEDYVPPTAEDGIVPRNEFGNVDFFLPSMLPQNCTHLQLEELDKIANILNIDCAPAMVGWAFAKRNISRPIYDGWIVCNENVKILKDAWVEHSRAKLEKLRNEKRKIVIKRWEILTRRLLVKERLKLEYNF